MLLIVAAAFSTHIKEFYNKMQKSPLLTSLCLLDCRNMYAGARYNNAKMKQFHEAHGHSLKMSVCLITNTFIFASIFFHIFVYWIHINLKERKYINISFLLFSVLLWIPFGLNNKCLKCIHCKSNSKNISWNPAISFKRLLFWLFPCLFFGGKEKWSKNIFTN